MSARPGWYLDPEVAGMRRYWDGSAWTGQRQPVKAATGFWTIAAAVTVGIVVAVIAIALYVSWQHQNDDLDCAMQNAQRVANGEPGIDCG